MSELATKKVFWKSKTFWTSIATTAVGFIPQGKEFIVQNPEAVCTLLGVVFALLRFVTKDKIVIL